MSIKSSSDEIGLKEHLKYSRNFRHYSCRRLLTPEIGMTKVYRVITSTLTLIFALSSPASAWNTRGHMMVAAVAYRKLTQKAKDRADALLLLNPDRDNWLDLIPAGTSAAKRKM